MPQPGVEGSYSSVSRASGWPQVLPGTSTTGWINKQEHRKQEDKGARRDDAAAATPFALGQLTLLSSYWRIGDDDASNGFFSRLLLWVIYYPEHKELHLNLPSSLIPQINGSY
jgi:hypothetical protein